MAALIPGASLGGRPAGDGCPARAALAHRLGACEVEAVAGAAVAVLGTVPAGGDTPVAAETSATAAAATLVLVAALFVAALAAALLRAA
jgi:hypothetical protein